MSQTIDGMNRISEVVQGSAKTIQSLAASSDQIGDIDSVINDIADQTSHLALNLVDLINDLHVAMTEKKGTSALCRILGILM